MLIWIVASIAASLLAGWLKFIPTYKKRFHSLLVHFLDTAMLTVVLSVCLAFHVYPEWVIVILMMFVTLSASIWIVDRLAKPQTESGDAPPV